MKKFVSILILILFCNISSFAAEFTDVPLGFWAYQEIDKLTDKGILSGVSDDLFNPQKYVTRAEYAVMLIKAIEEENRLIENMQSFDDLDKNHWAWPYVIRAVDLDILKATDGYFYPNDYVTRSEMITFLVNILKTEGITKKDAIVALQNTYVDFDDIPDWFKVTAGKAEVIDVIAKEPPRQNYLDYDKYVTRAQMAVFIYNMKEKLFSYLKEEKKQSLTPKTAEGIVIDNTIRNEDIVTIPEKTMLPIVVVGELNSETMIEGKMIQSKLADNITDNEHNLLLPKDIILVGKVLNVIKSKNFIRNGGLLIEFSSINKDGNYTKIFAVAEYKADTSQDGKIKKVANKLMKGRDFIVKDGQILYIKLYHPIRVNVATGEILD